MANPQAKSLVHAGEWNGAVAEINCFDEFPGEQRIALRGLGQLLSKAARMLRIQGERFRAARVLEEEQAFEKGEPRRVQFTQVRHRLASINPICGFGFPWPLPARVPLPVAATSGI